MSYRFAPQEGLIIVPTRVFGPAGDAIVRLALDTGATGTLINTEVLVVLGYDPATALQRPRITIRRTLTSFPVLCHTLPPSSRIDGLLGLDFFRGCYLGIDFRNSEITVT